MKNISMSDLLGTDYFRLVSEPVHTSSQLLFELLATSSQVGLERAYLFGMAGHHHPITIAFRAGDSDAAEVSKHFVSTSRFSSTTLLDALGSVVQPLAPPNILAADFERYLVETEKYSCQLLEFACIEPQRSLTGAFELMISLIASTPPGLPKGLLAYVSHSEALISQSPTPSRVRERLAHVYEINRSELVARARQIVELQGKSGVNAGVESTLGNLSGWVDANSRFRETLLALARSGQLLEASAREKGSLPSSFHQAIAGNRQLVDFMNRSPRFRSLRALLSFQYLNLLRGGISMKQRALLSYLAGKALTDLLGVDPLDLISEFRAADP